MSTIDNLLYPTPIPAKIYGCSQFGVNRSCWVPNFMVTFKIPKRYRQTDGRTDNLPWQYRDRSTKLRAVKT